MKNYLLVKESAYQQTLEFCCILYSLGDPHVGSVSPVLMESIGHQLIGDQQTK